MMRKAEGEKMEKLSEEKMENNYENYFKKTNRKSIVDTAVVKESTKLVDSVRHSVGSFLRSIVRPSVSKQPGVSAQYIEFIVF
jgi:hypothetical protein